MQRLNKEVAPQASQSRPPGFDGKHQARSRTSPSSRRKRHAALAGTHGQ
jgi:hypothetical protein